MLAVGRSTTLDFTDWLKGRSTTELFIGAELEGVLILLLLLVLLSGGGKGIAALRLEEGLASGCGPWTSHFTDFFGPVLGELKAVEGVELVVSVATISSRGDERMDLSGGFGDEGGGVEGDAGG